MQTAYRQAGPNERRLFNQAFFERLEISEEEVVGSDLAEPFDRLREPERQAKTETERVKAELAAAWNWESENRGSGSAEPFAGTVEAETPGPFSGAEGSNVETLVRLRGVEPPRVLPPTRPSTSGLGAFSLVFGSLRRPEVIHGHAG